MTPFINLKISLALLAGKFCRDRRGTSAVEFAILATPFFFLLLGVAQVGIFYMTQSALDSGTIKAAETLRGNFTTGSTAVLPDAATLKNTIFNNTGTMIANGSLKVEVRQLSNLSSAVIPISDGTTDYGTNTTTLVVRASATAITFTPGLSGLSTLYSSALVRRQGT